jgi:hypothetical protein
LRICAQVFSETFVQNSALFLPSKIAKVLPQKAHPRIHTQKREEEEEEEDCSLFLRHRGCGLTQIYPSE